MYCSKYAHVITTSQWVVTYNAFQGGAVALSYDLLPFLKLDGNRILAIDDKMPQKIMDLLIDKHIISEDPEIDSHDENQRRSVIEQAYKGELIQSIRLTLTKACNCVCSYCYVDKEAFIPPLNVQDCIDFIDKTISLSNKREYSVRFFGGEPTLEFETIVRVVDYLKKEHPDKNFNYLLNTNAQRLTHEMINYLKETNFKTVISLDSVKPYNDSQRVSRIHESYYDEAIKQIKIFADNKMQFVVGAVLTNNNIHALPVFLEIMREIGVKNVGLNHAKMVGPDVVKLNQQFANAILDAYIFGIHNKMNISGYWYLPYKRMLQGTHVGYCGGLGYELDLRPDRQIYSCVGNSSPLGKLDSLSDIFQSEHYLSIVNRVPPNINHCKGCDLEGLCAGECACDAQYVCKDFYSINPALCSFQKYITRSLLEYTFSKEI